MFVSGVAWQRDKHFGAVAFGVGEHGHWRLDEITWEVVEYFNKYFLKSELVTPAQSTALHRSTGEYTAGIG